MLNWIVWNRTIFIKMDLALNNLQRLICHKNPNNQPSDSRLKTQYTQTKFSSMKLHFGVYVATDIHPCPSTSFCTCYCHKRSFFFICNIILRKQFISLPWKKTYCHEYIIIIISCRRHGYPWSLLATSPYRSSPLVGLQGHIPYPHIAAECMFELVILLLPGHMRGSIGVHHLWARPWIVFMIGGRWPYSWCLVGCCHLDLFNIARSILV